MNVNFEKSLFIVFGQSGVPVNQVMREITRENQSYEAVTPIGEAKSFGYRSQDIDNIANRGKSAVVAAFSPSALASLQNWASSNNLNHFTAFVTCDQALSFTRALTNWRANRVGEGSAYGSFEGVGATPEELLAAYEQGEVICLDRSHFWGDMSTRDLLDRFSSILKAESFLESTLKFDHSSIYDPLSENPALDVAQSVILSHSENSLENGIGEIAKPSAKPSPKEGPQNASKNDMRGP